MRVYCQLLFPVNPALTCWMIDLGYLVLGSGLAPRAFIEYMMAAGGTVVRNADTVATSIADPSGSADVWCWDPRKRVLTPFWKAGLPKTPEIAQTAMRARIRGVYGDSVGRSERRFCNLRLAYRGQRDPLSPNTSRRFDATAPRTVLQS